MQQRQLLKRPVSRSPTTTYVSTSPSNSSKTAAGGDEDDAAAVFRARAEDLGVSLINPAQQARFVARLLHGVVDPEPPAGAGSENAAPAPAGLALRRSVSVGDALTAKPSSSPPLAPVLDLSGGALGPRATEELARFAGRRRNTYGRVVLSNNPIGNDGSAALVRLLGTQAESLASLDLCGVGLSGAGIATIMKAACSLDRLESLRLSSNGASNRMVLGEEGAAVLGELLLHPALSELFLSGVLARSLPSLVPPAPAAVPPSKIKTLDLSNNALTVRDAQRLAEALPFLGALRRLHLADNPAIGDDGMWAMLVSAPARIRKLERLDVARTGLASSGLLLLDLAELVELSLAGNPLQRARPGTVLGRAHALWRGDVRGDRGAGGDEDETETYGHEFDDEDDEYYRDGDDAYDVSGIGSGGGGGGRTRGYHHYGHSSSYRSHQRSPSAATSDTSATDVAAAAAALTAALPPTPHRALALLDISNCSATDAVARDLVRGLLPEDSAGPRSVTLLRVFRADGNAFGESAVPSLEILLRASPDLELASLAGNLFEDGGAVRLVAAMPRGCIVLSHNRLTEVAVTELTRTMHGPAGPRGPKWVVARGASVSSALAVSLEHAADAQERAWAATAPKRERDALTRVNAVRRVGAELEKLLNEEKVVHRRVKSKLTRAESRLDDELEALAVETERLEDERERLAGESRSRTAGTLRDIEHQAEDARAELMREEADTHTKVEAVRRQTGALRRLVQNSERELAAAAARSRAELAPLEADLQGAEAEVAATASDISRELHQLHGFLLLLTSEQEKNDGRKSKRKTGTAVPAKRSSSKKNVVASGRWSSASGTFVTQPGVIPFDRVSKEVRKKQQEDADAARAEKVRQEKLKRIAEIDERAKRLDQLNGGNFF